MNHHDAQYLLVSSIRGLPLISIVDHVCTTVHTMLSAQDGQRLLRQSTLHHYYPLMALLWNVYLSVCSSLLQQVSWSRGSLVYLMGMPSGKGISGVSDGYAIDQVSSFETTHAPTFSGTAGDWFSRTPIFFY